MNYLVRVAAVTGVRPTWLLSGDESASPTGPETWVDEAMRDLSAQIAGLSIADLEGILEYLESEQGEVSHEQAESPVGTLALRRRVSDAFYGQLPDDLPPQVQLLVLEVVGRFFQAAEAGPGWDEDSWAQLGRDIWWMLSLPERRGLTRLRSDRRFKDFACGVLLAMRSLVPERQNESLPSAYREESLKGGRS